MKNIGKKSEARLLIFCENVRLLRKREGLTQKEMAKRLKISVKSLSRIEKGTVPPRLSCEIVVNIYFEFGIDTSDVLKKRLF